MRGAKRGARCGRRGKGGELTPGRASVLLPAKEGETNDSSAGYFGLGYCCTRKMGSRSPHGKQRYCTKLRQFCLEPAKAMEWSDLRVFLAIAREGTLGGAARSLGQTQPTMGRRLRALESAVGHTLFQRTAEGFVLTDEGNAILVHAERIEEEALALQRQLAGQEARLEVMLRLSSSDWFGSHVLAPVLAEFGRLHPRVCIELLTDARIYSLPRREADMVFRITPFDEPEVISRRLLHMPYGLYGLPGANSRASVMGRGRGSSRWTSPSPRCQTPSG